MTAFAALHTALPATQGENEVVYTGYHRIAAECEIGAINLYIDFPEITEDTALIATHFSLGENEDGSGKILLAAKCEPNIAIKKMHPGKVPNIILTYPPTLAKSARVLHQMVITGKMRTEEIDPRLFEETNDHLQAHGIPILTVVRAGAAGFVGKIANMPSFNLPN